MKAKSLAIAATLALGMVAGATVLAATPFGNNSQKGSLLIYPRVQFGEGTDTLITLVNDSSGPVRLKCYYASSDPVPTPNTLANTSPTVRGWKHKVDFTIDLTHNQPISWFVSSGRGLDDPNVAVAPPFGNFPDGAFRNRGELKCWAVTNLGDTERHWNHLFGTASVLDTGTTQAYEYTAWAFQATGGAGLTGSPLGSPGALVLDGSEYDPCPNILVGDYVSIGAPPDGLGAPGTEVTLASCNQDLRQTYFPTITKLTWTFWNQDEQARTGAHQCANSWYETTFPADRFFNASFGSLGTFAAYFRIETTPDVQVCGPSAAESSYVGVKRDDFGGGYVRGTNLTGRGVAPGVILYDVGPPDDFKKPQ
jgi:hypothetical protein